MQIGIAKKAIGYGCGNNTSVEAVGYTDAMEYHTGTSQIEKSNYGLGTQYRNIEGMWDNVYDWVDGCYYGSSSMNVILDPQKFSDSTNGMSIGEPSNGYPSVITIIQQLNNQWMLPTSGGGSNETYTTDFWEASLSYPLLKVGGSFAETLGDGMFSLSSSRRGSEETNIGCRLMKLPNNT